MSYHRAQRTSLSGTAVQPMAVDAPFPEPWESYGQKAAAAIMARVALLPPARKKPELKKLLHTIDPSLWSRSAEVTRRYMKRGAAPAQALQAGLARAMSAGVIAELARVGKAGAAAKPSGQVKLGLGSAERQSLGVVGAAAHEMTTSIVGQQVAVQTDIGGPHYANGTSTSDGKLVWSTLTSSWQVRAPSDTVVGTAPVSTAQVIASRAKICVGPFVLDLSSGPAVTAQSVSDPTILFKGPSGQFTTYRYPFQIPDLKRWQPWFQHAAQVAASSSAGRMKGVPLPRTSGYLISSDGTTIGQMSANGTLVPNSVGKVRADVAVASGGHPKYPNKISFATDAYGYPVQRAQYANDPNTYEFYGEWELLYALGGADLVMSVPGGPAADGMFAGMPLTNDNTSEYHNFFSSGTNVAPFAKFTHPTTGDTWGLWMGIHTDAGGWWGLGVGEWNTVTDAPATAVLEVVLAPMPSEQWYDYMLDALLYIPGLIVEALGDLVSVVGDIACATVGSPGAAGGAARIPGPTGAAAAGGAALVGALCNGMPPPQGPRVASSSILPLAIAGAALGVIYVITKPKKKPAPAKAPPK